MICSYILTALVAFLIGGAMGYCDRKKDIKRYKSKIMIILNYYRNMSKDERERCLILDFDDFENWESIDYSLNTNEDLK